MFVGGNVSWTAPFSLRDDLITYCVKVTGSDSEVFSQCNITDTTLRIPPEALFSQDIACNLYRVTVISSNSLGNGTASSVVLSLQARGTFVIWLSVRRQYKHCIFFLC